METSDWLDWMLCQSISELDQEMLLKETAWAAQDSHRFSRGFERKMKRLMRKGQRKTSTPERTIHSKRGMAAVILVAILMLTATAVLAENFRKIVETFHWYDADQGADVYYYKSKGKDEEDTSVEWVYPSYIPPGYEKISEILNQELKRLNLIYQNADGMEISYKMNILGNGTVYYDAEYDSRETVRINGLEWLTTYRKDAYRNARAQKGDVLYYVGTSDELPKEELIQILEGIVPAERDAEEVKKEVERAPWSDDRNRAWAEAFCSRDGQTLRSLYDADGEKSFYQMEIVQSSLQDENPVIGWSSPWPMDGHYAVESDGNQTVFTYYAMTSDPHRFVWKQKVSWKETEGSWHGNEEAFVQYDQISSAAEFEDAYSGSIAGTPMDYQTDSEGWEEALECLAESEEAYGAQLKTPEKAAAYLLNLSGGMGEIIKQGDKKALVTYHFEDGSQVFLEMRASKQGIIWLPENVVDYGLYEELTEKVTETMKKASGESELDPWPDNPEYSMALLTCGSYGTPGYLRQDLDENGIDELIFGVTDTDDSSCVIYDVYTLSGGELVHVVNGWERNRYYLCENGMIANEGVSGAGNFNYAYFAMSDGEISLAESVIYDGMKDQAHPWFYSTKSEYDAQEAEPISEEKALEIREKYRYQKLELIPFAENP